MREWRMLRLLTLLSALTSGLFRSRRDLLLENLALRQQLAAMSQRRSLPRLAACDRLFWVLLHRFWSGWRDALVIMRVVVSFLASCSFVLVTTVAQ